MAVRTRIFILALIACALFLIPNLLWGNLYIAGGDDSRLYYLFPTEYLRNYAFNLISHNTLGGNLGYIPVSYSVPVVFLLSVLKAVLPTLNIQFISYGFIFSLGYVFFYLLLSELTPKRSVYTFCGGIVCSLFYLFSPYVTRTYFQHQIISIFLLMVVPGTLFFFVRGVKKRRLMFVVLSALFFSIFSSSVYSFPWLLPTLFTLVPFLIWLAFNQWKYFWKYAAVWVAIVAMLNFYWIIHYLIPVFLHSGSEGLVGALSTRSFIEENHNLISALSLLNTPVSQIISFVRTGWADRQGITVWEALGSMYLLVILYAGTLLGKVRRDTRTLYLVSISGLIVSMMLVTPNFGSWNLSLFEFLNDHVPFFGIARTMYDKFALGIAIQYALALYVSLIILDECRVKHVFRYIAGIILLGFTIANALPYIRPVYNDAAYSTRISGAMNHDYLDMTSYIAAMPTTSRFLWYPMTFPGYVYIGDEKNPHHFYAGLSPLQILASKSDLAGFYGLPTSVDPELNWKMLDLLTNRSYSELGTIFASQNIGYVIVNHEELPSQGFASLDGFNFMKMQNTQYRDEILGEKVKDFGDRYSLYTLNNKFAVPTVFLSKTIEGKPAADQKVVFRELSNGDYDVTIDSIAEPMQLVLLESYSNLWKVRITHGNVTISPNPTPAFGYGNAWSVRPVGDTSPVYLQIHFWPNTFTLQ